MSWREGTGPTAAKDYISPWWSPAPGIRPIIIATAGVRENRWLKTVIIIIVIHFRDIIILLNKRHSTPSKSPPATPRKRIGRLSTAVWCLVLKRRHASSTVDYRPRKCLTWHFYKPLHTFKWNYFVSASLKQ